MAGKIITTKFKEYLLKQALEKIVEENYMIIYEGKTRKIKKIFILNKNKNPKYKLLDNFYKNTFPNLETLKEIVTKNVIKEHPNAKIWEVIPHSDLYGNLVSYVFTFYLGNGDGPKRASLIKEIESAWEDKKKALEDIHSGYIERDSAKISKAGAISKEAGSKISGGDNFLSLEVGASYEMSPVMAFWNGLPLDISQYPEALDTIKEKIKGEKITHKATHTTGLFSIAFEFEIDNKKYYVDNRGWNVFTSWDQIKKDESEEIKKRKNDIKDKNRSKWVEFLEI